MNKTERNFGKYSIKISKIENGKGYWNSTNVEIFDKAGQKLGEYIRYYGSRGLETFSPFTFKGKDYALYSSNYNTIQIMTLPDCKPVKLKEECEKQLINYCPVEILVPKYSVTEFIYEGNVQYSLNQVMDENVEKIEIEKGDKLIGIFDSSIAFTLGCVWGDDYLMKFNILDLSGIENGELWYIDKDLNHRWIYEAFPSQCSLKDISCEYDDNYLTKESYINIMPAYIEQIKCEYLHFKTIKEEKVDQE